MLSLWCALASADEPSWTVTVDPLTTAIGFVHVQVERVVAPRASLYFGPSLRLFDGVLAPVNGPYVGVGAEVGVRGFFGGQAPEGAWVMARGVVARVSSEGSSAPGGYTSGLIGYTAVLGPGLVLSGGGGASWFRYGVGGYGVYGFAPALHTNVGWAL